MKVPKKITRKNAFRDKTVFENFRGGIHPGILQSKSKTFFWPTDEQLADQCYNLSSFLDAVILVRLIWYRDNSPGNLVWPEDMKLDDPEMFSKADEIMDTIIRGFWIAVNMPDPDADRTEEQNEQVREARQLLAKYWEHLWC